MRRSRYILPSRWREKKEFAMDQVLKGLEQYGIALDTESVSDAIEAALKEIKTAIDGSWDGSQADSEVLEVTA